MSLSPNENIDRPKLIVIIVAKILEKLHVIFLRSLIVV